MGCLIGDGLGAEVAKRWCGGRCCCEGSSTALTTCTCLTIQQAQATRDDADPEARATNELTLTYFHPGKLHPLLPAVNNRS